MDIIISSDRPAYRILGENGFYGPNDHLYREGDTIYFDGEPNEDMEPLNDLARTNLEVFFAKVDEGAKIAAAAHGRSFRQRVRIQDRMRMASADARRVQTVENGVGIPLMKGNDEDRKATIETIGIPEVPIMGATHEPPKRRGRPPKVLATVA